MDTLTAHDVTLTRVLVLLAVLLVAALLTRCPVQDLQDAPFPPPAGDSR